MFTVLMVFPGRKLAIPASTLSTAKSLMRAELLNSDAVLIRIVISQGTDVVLKVTAHAKQSEVA